MARQAALCSFTAWIVSLVSFLLARIGRSHMQAVSGSVAEIGIVGVPHPARKILRSSAAGSHGDPNSVKSLCICIAYLLSASLVDQLAALQLTGQPIDQLQSAAEY